MLGKTKAGEEGNGRMRRLEGITDSMGTKLGNAPADDEGQPVRGLQKVGDDLVTELRQEPAAES